MRLGPRLGRTGCHKTSMSRGWLRPPCQLPKARWVQPQEAAIVDAMARVRPHIFRCLFFGVIWTSHG